MTNDLPFRPEEVGWKVGVEGKGRRGVGKETRDQTKDMLKSCTGSKYNGKTTTKKYSKSILLINDVCFGRVLLN